MRIVGGRLKGRPLAAPPGRELRPTSDRVRESLFNVLEHKIGPGAIKGAIVADLFAGTGALGLEALSRGARQASFIDVSSNSLKQAHRNAASLGVAHKTAIFRLDATCLPPAARVVGTPCDLVFLDPPYEKGMALSCLLGLTARGWLQDGTIVVAEVAARESLEPPTHTTLLDERIWGAARVLFLRFTTVSEKLGSLE